MCSAWRRPSLINDCATQGERGYTAGSPTPPALMKRAQARQTGEDPGSRGEGGGGGAAGWHCLICLCRGEQRGQLRRNTFRPFVYLFRSR